MLSLLPGTFQQVATGSQLIIKACLQRLLGVQGLRLQCTATQPLGCQAARLGHGGIGHGHADCHFVETDIEGSRRADPIVGQQQHEGGLGHGMAGAGDDHGRRIVQQRQGQLVTRSTHGITGRAASGNQPAIIAATEAAGTAIYKQGCICCPGFSDGRQQLLQHLLGQSIDLAIVQGDFRHAVGDAQSQAAHALACALASSRKTRRSSLPTEDLGSSSRISIWLGTL